MTLPRETLATGAPDTCSDCKKKMSLEVLCSAAGFYVGTHCNCGPYTRESGYYRTRTQAEKALNLGRIKR